MKKTAAVLAAAGLSTRMESFKPMLPFGESTISRHIVNMLKELSVDPVVVVTGYMAAELEEHLRRQGVRFVRNEQYRETQMFDSVKLGIREAARLCDRLMIMPMDIPAIMPDTVRRVMMIDARIVRTVCGGEPGHPIMIQSSLADRICAYGGNRGLRGAVEECGVGITDLEVEDEGAYRDADTRDQYRELLGLYRGGVRNLDFGG